MEKIMFFSIAIAILVVHKILTSRNQVWLGSIIPTIYLVSVILLFKKTDGSLNLFPFVILFVLMIADWGIGYNNRKKRLKKELEKMQSQDLK
ncbi:hypothetical protein [Paraliobacillus sp. JSM ZJ581]|uniref:hypothetical protein n=1 Tax=Paraliobacillus sp. JSM ZJ581 TaxID=3342118 RepID=UPI0035A82D8C